MSSPASNLRSKVFAFIDPHLFTSRPPHGDQSYIFIPPSDHRGPMLLTDLADQQPSRFAAGARRNLHQRGVCPKCLSFLKINAMLPLVPTLFSGSYSNFIASSKPPLTV